MQHRALLALFFVFSSLAWLAPRRAAASDIPCGPVEPGTVQVDGLLLDWKGMQGVGVEEAAQVVRGRKAWSGPDDLSFGVYCGYDKTSIYLAVNVKDEYFVRTRKAKGDDHVLLLLGRKRLRVYPGDLRKIRSRMSWGRRGRVRGIQMAEAMQRGGYSVELRIPFRQLSGFRSGAPTYPAAVQVADSDSKAKMAVETVMGTARSTRGGRLLFAQAQAEMDGFLRDKGYSASQIRSSFNVNVVGSSQVEQVVLVGRTLGIIGSELPGGAYFYLDLPVRRPKDIYWVKPMDLNGDGKAELVTRYVERAGNGRRELIVVFRFNDADKFVRAMAQEILKGQGRRMITNRFHTKRRRRRGRRKGGIDLIVDKPKARGFTKDNYREMESSECYSILLPWGEKKQRRFVFEGEGFAVR